MGNKDEGDGEGEACRGAISSFCVMVIGDIGGD